MHFGCAAMGLYCGLWALCVALWGSGTQFPNSSAIDMLPSIIDAILVGLSNLPV